MRIFFNFYRYYDFNFAVKLQLNIVNNVQQHSMSIVTLLKKKKNNRKTITEILIASIKTVTKFIFVLGIIPIGITVVLLVGICWITSNTSRQHYSLHSNQYNFYCFFFCREKFNGITTFTELLNFTGNIFL